MRNVKTVLDLIFPGRKVSVVYNDEMLSEDERVSSTRTEKERLNDLVKWAERAVEDNEANPSNLAREILENKDRMIINAVEKFTNRSSAIAYKKQRIGLWKALGYKIVVR